MTRIYDLAKVFRSKNAGPLFVTFDIIFADKHTFQRVLNSGAINAATIARLYQLTPEEVRIIPYAPAHAIKITLPRQGPTSGSPGDRDVYGAQQHRPLLELTVAET